MFAGFALAAALAWVSEWGLGVLTPSDAVAYPMLMVTGLVLGAVVKADAGRLLLAQRLGVLAVVLYLVLTQFGWLLQPPRSPYPLATFSPWVLCAHLLVYTSWPARQALPRSAGLWLVLTLPPLLAVLGQGPTADWAVQTLPVTVNAAMAQMCFAAVMHGLSVQMGRLMQLAPDGAGQHLSAGELVALGMAQRERDQRAATAGQTAKSSFLAVVGHEMRTPLNIIHAGIDAVLRQGPPVGQVAALQQARQASDDLLRLLAQTLEFARLEDGVVTLELQPVQVADLAREALSAARSTARDSLLSVDFELRSPQLNGAGGWLMLDAAHVRQVLDVLLGNALRFTQAGNVRLSLQLMPDSQPTVVFEVRDTGIGMDLAGEGQGFDPFEPFSQAADPLRRSRGGLGLGLAIAQRLTLQMSGTLQLSSQPGAGTCAVLVLPCQAAAMPAGLAGPAAGPQWTDEPEPDTMAWRRASPNPLHARQRQALLRLLADQDSAALSAWDSQREAWAGVLPLADLAQAERAMAAIDFDAARALLAPHHEREDT